MKPVYLLLLSVFFSSCAATHYIYIVRHAEKKDNTPYSVLSPAGHERAAALRDKLSDKNIGVIYATTFQRTQETAQPLATALNLPLSIYRNNAVDSIVKIVKAIKNKNILLVGHSGNIPSIIKGLTGQSVDPIDENVYNNLYIIKTKKEKSRLIHEKYD